MKLLLALAALAGSANAAEIIGFNGQELTYWNKAQPHGLKHDVLRAVHPAAVHMINLKKDATPALDLVRGLVAVELPQGESEHLEVLTEIQKLAKTLVAKNDEKLASKQLPFFEQNLAELSSLLNTEAMKKDASVKPVASKIDKMRSKMCEKNFKSKSCQDFMKEHCDPGKDMNMDGDKGEADHGSNNCDNFFDSANLEPKKEMKEEPKKEESAEAKPLDALPSQGFEGKKIAHADGKTWTDDWRSEFGPRQRDTYASVCAQYPNNEWCHANGYSGMFKQMENNISEKDYLPLAILFILFVLAAMGVYNFMK